MPNATNLRADIIKIKQKKKFLLTELLNRFDTVCNRDEICLTKQEFMNEVIKEIREEIETNTFRPDGPANPTEWLSTNDINKIMLQYEKVYPDFKFMGAVPLNCNELAFCSLYKINFDKYLQKGIKRMGIIFNHDRHGQPGSHWVALFIDIVNGEIDFCDSMGREPIGNINHVIENFMIYYKNKTGKDATYNYNKKKYQKDNSECGIYSCNFIIRRLAGETFDDIVNNNLNFKEINGCRNVFFKNKPSHNKPNEKCDRMHKQ